MNTLPLIYRSALDIFFNVASNWKTSTSKLRGRPCVNLRPVCRAILLMLLRGWTWRDIPRSYGARSTIFDYFRKWATQGLFREVWRLVVQYLINIAKISFQLVYIDGSDKPVKNMKAEHTGLSYKHRSKKSLKITLIITKEGVPVSVHTCPGSEHDTAAVEPTFKDFIIEPSEDSSREAFADKGYVGEKSQDIAKNAGFDLYTPLKSGEKKRQPHSEKVQKKMRNRSIIERAFARLYQFNRINVIRDKTIESFSGWLHLALGVIAIGYIK